MSEPERVCPLCSQVIPVGAGVYHADVRLLACQGDCSERIDQARRVYDRSKRGRWRSRREVLNELKLA